VRAGRRLGVPVVSGSRGSDLLRIGDPWTLRMTRQVVRQSDAISVVSGELKERAVALGAEPRKVRVIPNGCDTTVFRPADRAAARAALGIEADARLILFAGHLIPGKGVLDLVEAFRRMDGTRDRLVFVGEGALRDELAKAASALGGRVTLAGSAAPEQVAQWLAASDLLALPSYSEGCPNVVIEALACGRPVVATTVGAIPDLVTPECGLLVRQGDVEGLVLALREALERKWDEGRIARIHRRSWTEAARETFELCLSVVRKAGEKPVSFS
jgi:glycosyltransferase involved in cell wall biosynthesis